jgi:hypothetical protein
MLLRCRGGSQRSAVAPTGQRGLGWRTRPDPGLDRINRA